MYCSRPHNINIDVQITVSLPIPLPLPWVSLSLCNVCFRPVVVIGFYPSTVKPRSRNSLLTTSRNTVAFSVQFVSRNWTNLKLPPDYITRHIFLFLNVIFSYFPPIFLSTCLDTYEKYCELKIVQHADRASMRNLEKEKLSIGYEG